MQRGSRLVSLCRLTIQRTPQTKCKPQWVRFLVRLRLSFHSFNCLAVALNYKPFCVILSSWPTKQSIISQIRNPVPQVNIAKWSILPNSRRAVNWFRDNRFIVQCLSVGVIPLLLSLYDLHKFLRLPNIFAFYVSSQGHSLHSSSFLLCPSVGHSQKKSRIKFNGKLAHNYFECARLWCSDYFCTAAEVQFTLWVGLVAALSLLAKLGKDRPRQSLRRDRRQ